MADNIKVTQGTDVDVRTEEITSKHYQVIKMAGGEAADETRVHAGGGVEANALRVTIASDSTGLISIDDGGNTITVDGTVDLGTTDSGYLSAIKTAVEILDNIVAGTEAQVDVITVPAPLNVVGGGTEAAALRVTIASDSTGLISIDDNGGSITIDGMVTANLGTTDTGYLSAIKTATEACKTALEATLTVSGTVTANLAAGTNNIGDVDVLTLPSIPAGTNNIGDVDVASIAAGETHIGEVGLADDTITVTPTLDTNAYADGDVLFNPVEIANAVRNNGDSCILQSVHVLDKADQGVAFELVFLKAATNLGTINAAISITAANAEDIIGHYAFSNSYIDLINSQILTDNGIGLMLEAGAATTSLYVAGISKGTGTYAADSLKITLGFLRN
jgi:hypothetical protein